MTTPIVMTHRIEAPPSTVYAYLTESEKWKLWQGAHADLDSRPGGLFSMGMPNGMLARGEFTELIPDRRVVLTWGWVGHDALPPGSSTVEFDLVPDGSGTVITLTHRGLPATEVEIHTVGWNHYLPRLVLAGQGLDPGEDQGPD